MHSFFIYLLIGSLSASKKTGIPVVRIVPFCAVTTVWIGGDGTGAMHCVLGDIVAVTIGCELAYVTTLFSFVFFKIWACRRSWNTNIKILLDYDKHKI